MVTARPDFRTLAVETLRRMWGSPRLEPWPHHVREVAAALEAVWIAAQGEVRT